MSKKQKKKHVSISFWGPIFKHGTDKIPSLGRKKGVNRARELSLVRQCRSTLSAEGVITTPPRCVARERSTPAVLGSGPFTARMPNPPGSLLGCGDSAACRIAYSTSDWEGWPRWLGNATGHCYSPVPAKCSPCSPTANQIRGLFLSHQVTNWAIMNNCQPNQGPVLQSPTELLWISYKSHDVPFFLVKASFCYGFPMVSPIHDVPQWHQATSPFSSP